MPAVVSAAPRPAEPIETLELLWLLAATLVGLLLRTWHLDRVAIEHFDEAVYSGNLWFTAEESYQYPFREFYAPYLWPAILEWWQILSGAGTGWRVVVPTILCGVATIPSVWWIARQWFGGLAGMTAMWMIALNALHVAYSRTALTDVPLTLILLWAMHAVAKLLERPSLQRGMIAGLFTGIAWSLKYSGWLPLAVLISAAPVSFWLARLPREWWKQLLRAGGLAILTAVVFWLPVLWDCQSVGGYAAVAANHAGYVRGWSAWWSGFVSLSQSYGQDNFMMGFAWLAAATCCYSLANRQREVRIWVWLGLSVAGNYLPDDIWGWTLGLAVIAIVLSMRTYARCQLSVGEIAAGTVFSAWFLGLTLTTPLYTPYPRLMLPWTLAALLIIAWGWYSNLSANRLFSVTRRQLVLILLQASLYPVIVIWNEQLALVESRTGYQQAAVAIANRVSQSPRSVVQVYALPAVVLGLRAQQVAAVVCGGPELAARVPEGWLVIDTRAARDVNWREGWAMVAERYELVETLPVQPSSIVRFDRPDPKVDPTEAILLYRRK